MKTLTHLLLAFTIALGCFSTLHAEENQWFKVTKCEEIFYRDSLLISYEFTSFPPNCEYKIVHEALDYTTKVVETDKTDEHGQVKNEKGPVQHVVYINGFSPGESTTYYFQAKDGSLKIKRELIPFPIEAIGSDGAKIEIIMRDLKVFECRCSGFKPNEIFTLRSISGDEEINREQTATDKGVLHTMILPSLKEKEGGKCQLSCIRQDEILEVSFAWGDKCKPVKPKGRKNVIPFSESKFAKSK